MYKHSDVMEGEGFELPYDLRALDESESLMIHSEAGTMNEKELELWFFFNEMTKHQKKWLAFSALTTI